ncbi:MAG: T9SS type A sorting domain-containing protein [Bacteroidetes bacterium]|nr:T9SS type A sorting domain-containing protein [Bacteroidota bacterium]
MKHILLLIASLCLLQKMQAQVPLYTENFNGSSSTFTLNTADNGCTVSGANSWIINNSYTGGSGSLVCLGFPFSFSISNTTQEPAGITGNPTSNYLHIVSAAAMSSSISCACYAAADGLCTMDENYFAAMSSDISTVGYSSVSINFWWLCGGSAEDYGQLYYSTNGGSTWNVTPVTYSASASTWQQTSVSSPAFANQSTLRFGFQFVNATTSSPVDPGMSIDDITITGSNTTGIETIPTEQASLQVSPNPCQDKLSVHCSGFANGKTKTIDLFNTLGACVYHTAGFTGNDSEIPVRTLPAGSYLLVVSDGGFQTHTRVVKTND